MAHSATQHWWRRWPQHIDGQWLYWLVAAIVLAVVIGALAASDVGFDSVWPFSQEDASS